MNKNKVTEKGKKTRVKYQKSLEMINPHAAGLDLHKEEIWACLLGSIRMKAQVKTFGTCTDEVRQLGKWLKQEGIESVAMESTGVFWVPVYNILSAMGIKPVLVNAREIKGVKGRPKTDKHDCMWICRLHSYGLLRGSFVPPVNITALKNLCDCREKIINESARAVQRIQKVLQMMNCRLDNAVSDVVGESGKRIIRAVLAGERNPQVLASLSDIRIEKKKTEIARDLDGEFREELLVVLEEWFAHHTFYAERLREINNKIYALLEKFPKKSNARKLPGKAANYREDKMLFSSPLRPILFEIFGTDLTQLTSVGASTVLSFLATVGTDVSSWPTENHFVSWLGLAPNPQISADYRKKGKTKRVKSLLAQDLKIAAMAAQRTDSFLGAFHRRIKIRIGPAKAKTATARKIAIILYRLVKYGSEAIKFPADKYDQLYKERKLKNMMKQAKQLGYTLVLDDKLNA